MSLMFALSALKYRMVSGSIPNFVFLPQ